MPYLISVVATVVALVVWFAVVRWRSGWFAAATWGLAVTLAAAGVAFGVLWVWGAGVVPLLAAAATALVALSTGRLVTDRRPDPKLVALLAAQGASPIEEQPVPAVGALYRTRTQLFCVAAIDDDDLEAEVWLRAAGRALSGIDDVRFVAVTPTGTRRTVTVGDLSAAVVPASQVRTVVQPSSRRNRRRRRS